MFVFIFPFEPIKSKTFLSFLPPSSIETQLASLLARLARGSVPILFESAQRRSPELLEQIEGKRRELRSRGAPLCLFATEDFFFFKEPAAAAAS